MARGDDIGCAVCFVIRDGVAYETKPTVAEYAYIPQLPRNASGDVVKIWARPILSMVVNWMYVTAGKQHLQGSS